MTESARPLVACLLPVRNCALHLPEWFETVRPFADTVIALDDGSTDDSAEVLARSDAVDVLVHNPRRDSYRGWDDAANRNRLLAAAADVRPRWIMQLDADERVDTDDAIALRRFIETDAEPGCGYLFQVFRMIGDRGHWDRATVWVARLFAFEAGLSFPDQRLHLRQLPMSIPPRRTHRTTVRIQHLASLTETDREARFRKYEEADPGNAYQASYASLLDPPTRAREWEPRPPALPVVVNGRGERLCLGKESIVTFPRGHVTVDPSSLAARLEDHEWGYAMVTGTIVNRTDTLAGWAAYFLEHAANLPGLPAEQLPLPPATCSYLRAALGWAGGFPARAADDTTVSRRLYARGYGAFRDPTIEFVYHSPCRTVGDFVRHQWTRSREPGRLVFVVRQVRRSRDRSLKWRFVRVAPLVVVGALIEWVQAWSRRSHQRAEGCR